MAHPLDLIVKEMLDYIEQASTYVADMTFEQYSADRKAQRAVERCIEVISEASRHIPDEIKGRRPDIPWRDVATIGNVFRHNYHTVAARIVWDTVRLDPPALKEAVSAIAELRSCRQMTTLQPSKSPDAREAGFRARASQGWSRGRHPPGSER
jgi:uncharacterized protein with HEPN domain